MPSFANGITGKISTMAEYTKITFRFKNQDLCIRQTSLNYVTIKPRFSLAKHPLNTAEVPRFAVHFNFEGLMGCLVDFIEAKVRVGKGFHVT